MLPLKASQQTANLRTCSEGQREQFYIDFPSSYDCGQSQIETITCPSEATAVQGDFFVFTEPGGTTISCWIDIDDDGTQPTSQQHVTANTKVRIAYSSFGTTGAESATLVYDGMTQAVGIGGGWGGTKVSDSIEFESLLKRRYLPIVCSNSGGTTTGSFATSLTRYGRRQSHDFGGKYLLISNASTNYYVWVYDNLEGDDPAVAGRTAVECGFAGDDTAEEAVQLLMESIDTITGLTVSRDGFRIKVVSDTNVNLSNASAGTMPVAVTIASQGSASYFTAGGSIAGSSNAGSEVS